MPKPIRDAQEKAWDVLKAHEKARKRRGEAREAARIAPAVDSEALATAARKGSKPPTPTAPTREHERAAAGDACQLLADDYEAAVQTLHRAIIEHLPAAMEAQRKAHAEAAEDADADAYVAKLTTLELEAGLLAKLAGMDEFKETRRGRRYWRRGSVHLDGPRRVYEDFDFFKLIPALQLAVEAYGKPITETVGERQEREAREAEPAKQTRKAWRAMARGGVAVR